MSSDDLAVPEFLLRKNHPEFNQRTPRPRPVAQTEPQVEAGRIRVFLTGLRGTGDGFHTVRVLSLGRKWVRIEVGGGKTARLARSKWDEIEAAAQATPVAAPKETTAMSNVSNATASSKSADDIEANRAAVEAGKILRARKAEGKPAPSKQAFGSKAKPAAKQERTPKGKTALMIKVLSRKNGATRAEVLQALEWPAINLKGVGPSIAKRFGYRYAQKKVDGITRYYLTKN